MGIMQASKQSSEPGITNRELETLQEIERRIIWLSTMMVHHANHIRPNPDKSKVGGHQASSSSVATILTALYFHFLRAGDRVSIKPHASPAYHAVQYLLGNLPQRYLTTLREFGGLQSYPSQTKDPDPVDFSTGSVGLGAVAPVFAALAHAYNELHFGEVTSNRFISLIGDAELDEGNIWETVAEEMVADLSNVIMIVDLNRQSLDRIIPGVRAGRLKALFAGAGWKVFETKYGTRLSAAMSGPNGAALRTRIDDMSNEEYQALIRLKDGAELRRRLSAVADAAQRKAILASVVDTPDDELGGLIANLGGHDLPCLLDVLEQADAVTDRPSVIFAYTIKGYALPIAGEPLNHSQLLTQKQVDTLRESYGISEEEMWSGFDPQSTAGEWCTAASARLAKSDPIGPLVDPAAIPATLNIRHPQQTSSQEALGRALARLADVPTLGERIVTISPDVATSTHLSGWINKLGVFARQPAIDFEESGPRLIKWQPTPTGHHIELGISEMNFFMAMGQFGLSYETTGQHLIPIGTVYDPFVCRGLDALNYSLYVGSKMIFAGTPAGVSLSPEGGAHQSSITPSIGIELPGVSFYEPCFAREVEWILLEAMRSCCDRKHGNSTYLRLSTKSIDQSLMNEPLERFGEAELQRQVLAGGYRLIDSRVSAPDIPVEHTVQIFTGGIMAPEAIAAAQALQAEGIAANVINVTGANNLFDDLRRARKSQMTNAYAPLDLGHLATLIPPAERRAPIVTIQDGASHALSFFGSVFGVPVVPLGVDEWGQSGSKEALYEATGIDTNSIISAGMLALELVQ